jgi:hypothetical protein
MSSYQQLCDLIDTVKAQSGKQVTVTVLPSVVKRKRKSLLWITQTDSPGDDSKPTELHKLH